MMGWAARAISFHTDGPNCVFDQRRIPCLNVKKTTFVFCERTFSFFFNIYLFIIYKYTVAVFRHTKRGHQIPLQIVVSHHVGAGN